MKLLWILKCCLDCYEVHVVLRECDSKFLNKMKNKTQENEFAS